MITTWWIINQQHLGVKSKSIRKVSNTDSADTRLPQRQTFDVIDHEKTYWIKMVSINKYCFGKEKCRFRSPSIFISFASFCYFRISDLFSKVICLGPPGSWCTRRASVHLLWPWDVWWKHWWTALSLRRRLNWCLGGTEERVKDGVKRHGWFDTVWRDH